jgi:pyruvate/2-oxoglutarate dehydrogenase complex dihydrolipoamide acyltransferase (E2) component
VKHTAVAVPELGADVEVAVLVSWLVKAGDEVVAGQPVAELAADKVDTEVTAPASGHVVRLAVDEHDAVHPGDLLIELGDAPSATSGMPPGPRPSDRLAVSPSKADAAGTKIVGSGLASREHRPARETVEPLSRVRRRIAQHMMAALATTAQLTAAVEVDLSAVMHLRQRIGESFRSRHGVRLSPLAMISRAVVLALLRHPAVNAAIDVEAGTITHHRYVDLGIAVQTDRGLLVPKVRDAHELTVAGLARGIGELARAARSGRLKPDDLVGGTFTITNTGSLGTLFGTPILSPPGAAILGTYAAEKRPVVVEEEHGDRIAIRWMSYLCLTYDHQLLDGADAARFLNEVKDLLEGYDFEAELGV